MMRISSLVLILLPMTVFSIVNLSVGVKSKLRQNQNIHMCSKSSSSQDLSIARQSFVKHVYSLLFVQLLVTTGITYKIRSTQALVHFFQEHSKATILTTAVASIASVLSIKRSKLRLNAPWNVVVLGFFTICKSIFIAATAVSKSARPALINSIHDNLKVICTSFLLGIGILCSFIPSTAFDLTINPFGKYFIHVLQSLVLLLLVNPTFIKNGVPYVHPVSTILTITLFSLYLLYDCSLIAGGKHRVRAYAPHEYVLASLNVYQDVITILLAFAGNPLLPVIIKLIKFATHIKKSKQLFEGEKSEALNLESLESSGVGWSSEYNSDSNSRFELSKKRWE